MMRAWYRLCHWTCANLYYERITVRHRARLPTRGPVIYLGTHRNGAVDGFIYRQIAPRCEFLISTQLLRSWFARLFFHGIPVTRDKDEGDRSQNEAALQACRTRLAAGGELFIFPEGTSSLGPRHLPFKSGAARLTLDCLELGMHPAIVPIAVHYECAWGFRTRVELEIGPAVDTALDPTVSRARQIIELKRRFAHALEAVGANFASAAEQQQAECLAFAATLGSSLSYIRALKSLETGVPEPLLTRWRELAAVLANRGVWRYQGVPLFPTRPWPLYAVALSVIAPFVAAGAALNLPPLLAGWLAARKMADDRNVIALWRILVGVPVFALWGVGFAGLLLATGGWPWAAAYGVATWAGLKGWPRMRKLTVAVGNALCHRAIAPQVREFHRLLLSTFTRTPASSPPASALPPHAVPFTST